MVPLRVVLDSGAQGGSRYTYCESCKKKKKKNVGVGVGRREGGRKGGAEKGGRGSDRFARISLWPLRGGSCLGFVI